ncbi:MAG: winged helix-turn-helix transcriptional regulator [Anaerolineales bacterium]|nr:winged helix-turn-helix transcriptional regulator [Anaerolineales bacterium]
MNAGNRDSAVFKSLGHPARLAILDALRGGEQCVCHLENVLGMRQAYLSQQLAVLKEAGLVRDRREGWNIYYFVSRPEIWVAVETVRSMPGMQIKTLLRRNTRHTHCPCPKCKPGAEQA